MLRLRQSYDRRLRAFLVDAGEPGRAALISYRLPLDLGDETVRMRRLVTILGKLVSRVTEGCTSILSEEVVKFIPLYLLYLNGMIERIRHQNLPQLG